MHIANTGVTFCDGRRIKTRAGVCKTLYPQHLLVHKYDRICSVVIPQTFLDFAQTFNR